ncbi:MAG: hypothetical protein JXR03_19855 [Cyclobacteriaceae bacterium]
MNNRKEVLRTVKSATDNILFSNDDFGLIKSGIDQLYDIFSRQTNVSAEDLTNDKFTVANHGSVVSQEVAAHCLKDLMRSTRFIRGVYKAIKDYSTSTKPVKVLYAGCGPYATLITPLTSQFTSKEVSVTMFDIEQASLDTVHGMYADWGLLDYVDRFVQGDGTDPSLQLEDTYNIIISETMQVALRKECQVPLTRNMVRFLTDKGTFIPENIVIDVLYESTLEPGAENEKHIASIYELKYDELPAINQVKKIPFPDESLEYFKMNTTIHIYGNEILKPTESGLTVPIILDRVAGKKRKGAIFTYTETAEIPGFEFEYIDE